MATTEQEHRLLCISPVDGRYANKCTTISLSDGFLTLVVTGTDLNHIFSEFGLIRQRVRVEVEWLKLMSDRSEFPEVVSTHYRYNSLTLGSVFIGP